MGAFTMGSRKLLLVMAVLGLSQISRAQSPTYGVGRTPPAEEIRKWDISIGPEGKELPPGSGTAVQGAGLFVRKACFGCHGETGSGGPAPTLIKSDGKTKSPYPCLNPCVNDSNLMSFHSPYATTIWDYINRAMPLTKEGTLKPNEVYALTAYLLFKNGIIREDEVMDAQSLPKVKMPNRDHFALAPEWKHGTPRLQGYP
ncbi:MAG TPA: cytochrome c [Verrucomicrobiae bacterium]|nr:cytochrome c [Verrucomicrobiae bacterium]